ncbi:MAG: response regulator [Desulfatitalea sp.]|nr:response regulator [Desulfatitalea sp.]NNK01325.1 response regulator [Desulfatitalea sp.]
MENDIEKVLYVDDEVANLKALKRLFRDEPFGLVTYDSPIQALKDIKTLKPKVVISDHCMPEMAGTEFLEKVKQRLPDSTRIILTGQADLEAAVEAINKGSVYRFIQKPWDNDDLKAQIRSALAHQETIGCLRTMLDSLADEIMANDRTRRTIHKLSMALSSEMKRPLSVITGYAQLLQNALAGDALIHGYLSNIIIQLGILDELANKIESISLAPGVHVMDRLAE